MRKSKILNVIKGQLQESDRIENSLLEISLDPLYEGGKRRIAFCSLDNDNWDHLDQQMRDAVENDYNINCHYHDNIDAAIEAFEGNDDVILENNWRGRLFHERHIQGRNEIGTREFLLNSFWRIIVTRHNGSYFVKNDIYPFFWSPGQSTGGHETYENSVRNYLEQFRENKALRMDSRFDYIKVFAKHEGVNTFSTMNYSSLGEANNIVSQVTFLELRNNYDEKVENVLAHLEQYFGN